MTRSRSPAASAASRAASTTASAASLSPIAHEHVGALDGPLAQTPSATSARLPRNVLRQPACRVRLGGCRFSRLGSPPWPAVGPSVRGSISCLAEARLGQSAVLVLRGEPGIGKSALLEYAAGRAEGCRIIRATGVEWEMELPFAGLHQLCVGLLEGRERLPAPQGDALATAFGLSPGAQPDRFLVGLAALSLLSDAAAEHPLVCLVDDVQWLDRSSAQVLAFVARRLAAESVVLLFAEREPSRLKELAGLPELRVGGLADAPARELLASVITAPVDERVRARILAETHGNPLALLELPREFSAEGFAGGFGLPGDGSLPARIEASFRRRVEQLPSETQRLLLVAAADPTGEPALLVRASEEIGVPIYELSPAEADGLLELGAQVTFRHPLLRSAIYRAAPSDERRAAHQALAAATDPDVRP